MKTTSDSLVVLFANNTSVYLAYVLTLVFLLHPPSPTATVPPPPLIPTALVVGTKGSRSMLQTWGQALGAPGMGSVSRYCVSHSPVPVIVVRPERKVKKSIAKRQNDPKRDGYKEMAGGVEMARSRSKDFPANGGDS